jgi:thioester reductase-like protein
MQDSADVFAVLTPALVYENPTAERLGTALFGLFNRGVGETIYVNGVDEHLPETLLQRYVQDLPSAITGNKQLRNGGNKIILTGSSGSLGSYILDTLLRQETVSHIFCLNRANDAETIQIEQAKQRDLRTIFPPFKVTFLQADLASPNLGLSDEAYEILSHDATHIVHAAWPVNFNMSLSSFEPSIRGVRNLISLAVTSRHAASLAFISSVATVAHLRDDAPEEPIPIFPPSATGYALSKHVSELLLQAAWARSGLDASVVRVGQIAGPVRRTAGAWSPHEMLPTLIATAKHLRLLPETLGPADRIDWIPVDIAADALVEVCGAADVPSVRAAPSTLAAPEEEEDAERTSVPTFNVANPETCEWADLLPTIRAQLGGEDVALVGWVEWVGAVEALETSPERDGVPGLKLLKTFQDMRQAVADGVAFPRLETERAELRSGTLASLTPVSAEWMALWLAQWQL